MNRSKIRLIPLAGICCALATVSAHSAHAQLRIVTWNAATDTNPNGDVARAGTDTVLQAMGIEAKNGIQKPVDVIALDEVTASLGGAQSFVNILNGIYGAGAYARSTLVGSSTDSTTQALIYNTQTVQLLDTVAIGTASTSGEARAPLRFHVAPVGYSSADFYIYASHYKSGTASSDQSRRQVEAQNIRTDANALPAGSRILFTGDYNMQSSTEQAYQTLTASGGTGQAIDPLNQPGTWHNSSSFASIHTQAPLVTTPTGSSLTGGGMDDRFDFQLTSSAMLTGNGVSYIGPSVPNLSGVPSQNSYHAFGNNGTTFNSNLNSASNTALPASEYAPAGSQPNRTTVLNALTTASDHLPVIADYQLPAKMSASVSPAPAQVIKGSSPTVTLSVTNSAPVVVALGADQLAYTASGSGDVSGSASAAALLALAAADQHTFSLNTATPGNHSGTVSGSSSSVQVANGSFSQVVSYTVLDHAAAEFLNPTATHTLHLDFGTLPVGSGPATQAFQIQNLAAAFRAGLDLNSFNEVGDTSNVFGTDLTSFSALAAGSSSSLYHVTLQTTQPGSFSADYLISLGDQSTIFGATGGQTLDLNVTGLVAAVPEPTAIVLAGLGAIGLLFARRRK